MRPRLYSLAALAILLPSSACTQQRAETYGFIATLGNDTTSVEQITRKGNRIISDAVGRSPIVTRRHWEATIAPDGSVTDWKLDTTIPNATSDITELHHAADFSKNPVILSKRLKSGATDVAYTKRYSVTVPWNAFVYGTYEVLFNAARTRDDSTHIGSYFFEGWDEGHVGYARVRKLGNGDYSIYSTGLAGEGVGHLDEQGRMLSYSGQGTTYKQEVKRVTDVPDIDEITKRFAADEKAKGVTRALSVRDTSRATIDGTTFTIDYSRPLARGRTLVGGLIPYDQVWRTGANAATQITVSESVAIAGANLDPGTYTLWTLPSANDVKLIINRQTGQWGTGYQATQDLARVVMKVDTLTSPVEQFTIRVEPDAGGGATSARLVMEWGTFRWSAPIATRAAAARR